MLNSSFNAPYAKISTIKYEETDNLNKALMHTLPRIEEILHDVDKDSRVAYFCQAGNGMLVCMVLTEWCQGLDK